jgi:AraC family transcriptional regulator of adaptative response/methylated-DNA-[protein]-cysteine methyltransferase
VADSPLGPPAGGGNPSRCLRAVCLGDDDGTLEAELRARLPGRRHLPRRWMRSPPLLPPFSTIWPALPRLDLPIDVRATAFHWQVWRALVAIPRGETRTYGCPSPPRLAIPRRPAPSGGPAASTRSPPFVPATCAVGRRRSLGRLSLGLERKRPACSTWKKRKKGD